MCIPLAKRQKIWFGPLQEKQVLQRAFQVAFHLYSLIIKHHFIWKKGNLWLQGIAPFQSNEMHQIMFEGVRGKDFFGDIVRKKMIGWNKEAC